MEKSNIKTLMLFEYLNHVAHAHNKLEIESCKYINRCTVSKTVIAVTKIRIEPFCPLVTENLAKWRTTVTGLCGFIKLAWFKFSW